MQFLRQVSLCCWIVSQHPWLQAEVPCNYCLLHSAALGLFPQTTHEILGSPSMLLLKCENFGGHQSGTVLLDDPERNTPPVQFLARQSSFMPGRTHAASPPFLPPGAPLLPWSYPSPPRSWDHAGLGSGGRHTGVRLYSPPQRFNMGYTPGRRQSIDSATRRPSRWSSPPVGRLASPHGGTLSPSSSMASPRGGRKGRVFWPSRLHRSPGHQSRGPESESPSYLEQDHTLVGSPAMAYSGRLRERSLSPMDCSHSPRGQASHCGEGQKDSGGSSSWGAAPDQLHAVGAAAHTPVVTPASPKPDRPAHSKHLNTDPPTQANLSSTDPLVSEPRLAQASPDDSCHAGSRSAASRLSPSHLAKVALPHSPRQGPQQSFQPPAANG